MAQGRPVVDDGAVRLEFVAAAAETDGQAHVMRATYQPDSPFPPAHLHPAQEESFEVVEGELLFVVDGQERVARAGETVVIPAGVVHQMRNQTDQPAVATWTTRPALRTGEFLQTMAAARQSADMRAIAAALEEFSDVFVLDPALRAAVPLSLPSQASSATPAPRPAPRPRIMDIVGPPSVVLIGGLLAVALVIILAIVLIFTIGGHWL